VRVPVSCRRFGRRHSLLGSSCARWGVEPSSRSADRRLLTCRRPPDPNGVVVLRMLKLRPGRAPALPRGRWCAPDRRLSSGRHPPLFRGQSLRPRWNIPPAGVTFTRRQHRFTHVRPSPPGGWMPPRSREPHGLPPVFSSPAAPGWNTDRFGFDPRLRTPRSPATHARAETGHRALARVLHPRHQSNLLRCLPLALMHHHVAPSRRSPR
jgi:hypothetical protein